MTKHTPGPWEIAGGYDGGWQIEYSADGEYRVIAARMPWPNRAMESEANARLIVSAPDLLEALKDAAAMIEDHYRQALGLASKAKKDKACREHVVIAKARAAIAKAEGNA